MSLDGTPFAPVLIVAPLGADAANTAGILAAAGLPVRICPNLAEVPAQLSDDCGALLLTEESVVPPGSDRVKEALARQPPWSDLPLILIASARPHRGAVGEALRSLGSPLAAVVLERPLHAATLVAAVRSGLAARRRQYQIRDLLHERDRLLDSLEDQVADRTAKLRQMVEELEGFSYSVSHDLRAPLRVLDGYARALAEDYAGKLDDQAQLYLDRISRAAQRMDRLTQDVLAYSRVTRMTLSLQPVELEPLVKEVVEQYPTLSPYERFIEIRSPLGTVLGHPPLLVQCFSNLLENAVKFAAPERRLHIVVAMERGGDLCRIWVEDNGRGIPPESLERIFGLFERAAPKEVTGTGIGLAIVKKAMERMGGVVRVSSTDGRGTRFCLELRAARPDVGSGAPAAAGEGAPRHFRDGPRAPRTALLQPSPA